MANKRIKISRLIAGRTEMRLAPLGHTFSIIHHRTREGVEYRKEYKKVSDTECEITREYQYS